MGERIIRPGIRNSDKTAALVREGGWMGQVFYDWLITAVDDYGRMDARPSVLRVEIFPLLLEQVREADVQRCLAACEKAGLIRLYQFENKPFLEVLNFRQRLRAKRSTWPCPDCRRRGRECICHDSVTTKSRQSHDDVTAMTAEERRKRDGDGRETETRIEALPAASKQENPPNHFAAVITALDAWSMVSEGHATGGGTTGEARIVHALIEAASQQPPIIQGDRSVRPDLLIPLACDFLQRNHAPFKSVAYAAAAVKNKLSDWAKKGLPGVKNESRDAPQPIRQKAGTSQKFAS